ncbi:right-handed parallel beta-helix repeat-containing protein [Pararhizobium sp. YC-54]|uniref:NosD domain-containing protein n=1 Tax=Pararhizobium sp. YC-54 TaxID=2986920 RepID=UPI0021F7F0C2|nr:NosD domain-containing protein [Pararhizobium sp. YC-54]MCV9999121.1 right-handed parallel beta-helix repeat-containing protein [Pararhizobium sp. YC-54]
MFAYIAMISGGMLALFFYPGAPLAKPMQCSADVHAAVKATATNQDASVELRCSLTLSPGDIVTKRLIFSGAGASGATLDCKGATLDGTRGSINFGKPAVLIRSTKGKNGDWSAPSDITVRNCVIKGALRLQGLGTNGQAKAVQLSSLTPDHTAFAQASAPRQIFLSALTLVADGRVPLYIGPGVTGVRLEKSTLTGKSDGPALYLDAESGGNTITGNRFAVESRREQIAIDGSAKNTIRGNIFDDPSGGGIFLYRNCGEGGTIRHQKPQHNTISGNTFKYQMAFMAKPAVWLNSRNGAQRYCFRDPAHPFGSSLNSKDFAQFNTVTGNRLIGGGAFLIRNSDPSNRIEDNGN